MNKRKATEMIKQQRRRWHSNDSDLAIARRSERVYLALAMTYVGVGTSLMLVQHTTFGRVAIVAGFLFGAIVLFLHSRRFGQIQKLLVDSEAKRDAH